MLSLFHFRRALIQKKGTNAFLHKVILNFKKTFFNFSPTSVLRASTSTERTQRFPRGEAAEKFTAFWLVCVKCFGEQSEGLVAFVQETESGAHLSR